MIRSLIIGCGVVCLLVIAVVIVNAPQSGMVEARETTLSDGGCVTREVALDPGYGVSRKVSQLICAGRE